MKAIVIEELGGIEVFKLKELEKPLVSSQEVRVRLKAAGFNPVDLKMRKGETPIKFPAILGADGSGVIDAVGEKFHEFSVGDEVLTFTFGQGSNGSYAEYLSVPKQFVVKKPSSITFEQAASFPLSGLTAYRAVVASGALQPNEPAFIAGGAGGVATFAIQLAQHFGADPIFCTAGSPESQERLIAEFHLKKEHLLDYKNLSVEQMKQKLIKMNGGKLIPACFDFVGGTMKQLCLEVADFSGHVATILPEAKNFPVNAWDRKTSPLFQKNLSLHSVFVGAESFGGLAPSWNIYRTHLKELMVLVEEKHLKIPKPELIGTLSVESVQKAHQKLEEGHVKGKIVMRVSK